MLYFYNFGKLYCVSEILSYAFFIPKCYNTKVSTGALIFRHTDLNAEYAILLSISLKRKKITKINCHSDKTNQTRIDQECSQKYKDLFKLVNVCQEGVTVNGKINTK